MGREASTLMACRVKFNDAPRQNRRKFLEILPTGRSGHSPQLPVPLAKRQEKPFVLHSADLHGGTASAISDEGVDEQSLEVSRAGRWVATRMVPVLVPLIE